MFNAETEAVLWVAIPKTMKLQLRQLALDNEITLKMMTVKALENYLAAVAVNVANRERS